jgi:hypothetical protein
MEGDEDFLVSRAAIALFYLALCWALSVLT